MIKNSITAMATVALTMMFTKMMFTNVLPIQAVPVTYDFTVVVTEGSLAGNTFNGSFSYDDEILNGVGTEEIDIADGLKVNMTFLEQNYTEKEDRDYPEFPKLIFEDGAIQRLDFWIEPNERGIWWGRPGWDIQLSPRDN